MEKESIEVEVKKLRRILFKWESMSPDDMIFTANCLKAVGAKNYKEFRIWERKNPEKGLVMGKNGEIIVMPNKI
jgi:hypothetical protein